ncbi:MAG TPA: SDR family NAD(P)-dependent oxidoreductase [Bacteroides sp.]|nr:SDR family NAD(P)-dependent oxidoreductase [Bacteroides sp.]
MTNNEKTALVTGANSGIGFETAAQLAGKGYGNIIFVARTIQKSVNTAARLREQGFKSNYIPLTMDTTEVKSAKEASGKLIEMGRQIDLLILNAGSAAADLTRNSNGVDLTFASTLVGHHVLTISLLEKGLLSDEANIVIAGSEAARGDVSGMALPDFDSISDAEFGSDIEKTLEAFARGYAPDKYHVMKAYSIAKLYVAWWASAISEKIPKGMRAFAISPGSVPGTNFGRNQSFMFRRVMIPLMGSFIGKAMGMSSPTSAGALRYISAVELPGETNGRFYASPPKKMTGIPEVVNTDLLNDYAKRDAAWNVIVGLSGGIDYFRARSAGSESANLKRKIA